MSKAENIYDLMHSGSLADIKLARLFLTHLNKQEKEELVKLYVSKFELKIQLGIHGAVLYHSICRYIPTYYGYVQLEIDQNYDKKVYKGDDGMMFTVTEYEEDYKDYCYPHSGSYCILFGTIEQYEYTRWPSRRAKYRANNKFYGKLSHLANKYYQQKEENRVNTLYKVFNYLINHRVQ